MTDFVTRWTVGAGETIVLPLYSGGTYNFTVNYGDGSGDLSVTAWNDANASHTYASADTYTVTISGTLIGWSFQTITTSATKIVDVVQWGDAQFQNGAFRGCSSLNHTAMDVPIFFGTSLASFFYGCTANNGKVSNWNVSGIINLANFFTNNSSFNRKLFFSAGGINFSGLLSSALSFNQSFSPIDFSNLGSHFTYLQNFISSGLVKTQYYSALLIHLAEKTSVSGIWFSGGSSKYYPGRAAAARAALVARGWAIADGGQDTSIHESAGLLMSA